MAVMDAYLRVPVKHPMSGSAAERPGRLAAGRLHHAARSQPGPLKAPLPAAAPALTGPEPPDGSFCTPVAGKLYSELQFEGAVLQPPLACEEP